MTTPITRATHLLLIGLALASAGCATRVSREVPLEKWSPALEAAYAAQTTAARSPELLVLLAFSGGGTRAASFSYGVLKELAATEVLTSDGPTRLDHEVDAISSVSGGSFTAAYFALRGDGIFDDFEKRFLRKDIEGALFRQMFKPASWLRLASRGYGRSDLAADYYSHTLFDDATFDDLVGGNAPMVVMNATELALGVRFSFTHGYFDLLCADFRKYPLGRAAAASSAVPGLLSPISLKNYSGECGYEPPPILAKAAHQHAQSIEQAYAESLIELENREDKPWLHLVDGGISDNLGLRSYWSYIAMKGGLEKAFPDLAQPGKHQVLVILVNAIRKPKPKWAVLGNSPSLLQILGAVSSIQIDRYDLDTIQLMEESLNQWAAQATTPEHPVTVNFVEVGFALVEDDAEREALNDIGTNFHLDDEEVDLLISAAGQILRESPEFKSFLETNRAMHAQPK